MSYAKSSARATREVEIFETPLEERQLPHPHLEDQVMAVLRPAAGTEPESSAFGLTVIEDADATGVKVNAAFDDTDGVGAAALVSETAVERTVPPLLEPESAEAVALSGGYADTADSGETAEAGIGEDESGEDESGRGFGFVLDDDGAQSDTFAEEGEDGPKGGVVFDTD